MKRLAERISRPPVDRMLGLAFIADVLENPKYTFCQNLVKPSFQYFNEIVKTDCLNWWCNDLSAVLHPWQPSLGPVPTDLLPSKVGNGILSMRKPQGHLQEQWLGKWNHQQPCERVVPVDKSSFWTIDDCFRFQLTEWDFRKFRLF